MEILETNLDAYPHRQDRLRDTLFGAASTQTDSSSRLLLVPKFLPKDLADKWYSELKEVLNTYGAVISKSKDSPDGDYAGYQYKTAQFMNCPCMYAYAGTARHKSYNLCGFGADQGPQVIYDMKQHFRQLFGLTNDQIPDCWIINGYYTEDKYINWHADDDHLFGAMDGNAEILSISLGADTVFCIKPTVDSKTAQFLGLPKNKCEKAIKDRNMRRLGSRM